MLVAFFVFVSNEFVSLRWFVILACDLIGGFVWEPKPRDWSQSRCRLDESEARFLIFLRG